MYMKIYMSSSSDIREALRPITEKSKACSSLTCVTRSSTLQDLFPLIQGVVCSSKLVGLPIATVSFQNGQVQLLLQVVPSTLDMIYRMKVASHENCYLPR